MTIAVETNRVVYTGNGATTVWPYNFSITDAATLEVYTYEISTGTLALVNPAQYNVSGVGNPAGGNVTYPLTGTLAATHKLIIQRIVDLLQPAQFSNAAGFDPATLTLQMDNTMRAVQQVNDAATRAIKVDISDTTTPEEFLEDLFAAAEAGADAAASAAAAAASAAAADASADDAADQVTLAAAQVTLAADQVALATTQAGNAATSASTATTQAGLAATAKTGAETARDQAATMIAAFLYNTIAAGGAADPGSGNVKPNNATIGSITAFYIDNVDATGVNVGAVLDDFGVGTSGVKSKLTIRKVGAAAVRHHFSVTAVADSTGYRTLSVTYIGGAGAIALGTDQLAFSFAVNGDKGDAGLGGGDVDGPVSSVADNIATFLDTTGKEIKDSGVAVSSLAPKNNAVFTGTFATAAGAIARSNLTNGAAVSVIGRSANSGGAVNDIAAGANDTFLQRVSNALSFGGLTIGMVADGLLTYAKLATAAISTTAEYLSNTASKLASVNALWAAAVPVTLTDAATITANFGLFIDSECALAGNRALGAPSGTKNGQKGVMWFTATTSTRVLTLDAAYLLMTGVEVGPYSITTAQLLGVAYVIRGGSVYVTAILRRG